MDSTTIPVNIDDNEILVRFIYKSDFKSKRIEKDKIKEGDVFLDTREPAVSLQRNMYCKRNRCKELARKINSEGFVGFVIFKKKSFEDVVEIHKIDRDEFEAAIKYSPIDEHGNYLEDNTNVLVNSSGAPAHSDLIYVNPAPLGEEVPNTAIRQFSRRLMKSSRVIIDKNPYDEELETCDFEI